MYVKNQWIHSTYATRFDAFMQRIEERFQGARQDSSPSDDTSPMAQVEELVARFPACAQRLLSAEDVDFFLHICKNLGKPVNFVPVIDKDLQFWFKKDSLWQSENVEFVQDQDADRTCILQGPVAVKHSTVANEPIGNILGSINRDIIKGLQSGGEIPVVEYLGGPAIHLHKTPLHATVSQAGSATTVVLPNNQHDLPAAEEWIEFLAGSEYSWWRAALTAPQLVVGKARSRNFFPVLMKPRAGQRVEIVRETLKADKKARPQILSVTVFAEGKPALQFAYNPQTLAISLTLNHEISPSVVPLVLTFQYKPNQGGTPIHSVTANDTIKRFYSKLWFQNGRIPSGAPSAGSSSPPLSDPFAAIHLESTFKAAKVLQREEITKFCSAIGTQPSVVREKVVAPVDYVIVACWESMMAALFAPQLDVDLLRLLHLSYGYDWLSNETLMEGDTVESNIEVTEVAITTTGKRVSVRGSLARGGARLAEVHSQFFIPGSYHDYQNTFKKTPLKTQMVVVDAKAKSVLESKSWVKLDSAHELQVGDTLLIEAMSIARPRNDRVASIRAEGTISLVEGSVFTRIGHVSFSGEDMLKCPVEAYLHRQAKNVDTTHLFADGGYALFAPSDNVATSPNENWTYAVASGDHNPIHTNPYLADVVGLPGPITHGMWTAALGRNLLESFLATSAPQQEQRRLRASRVRAYTANFVDKVTASENLFVRLRHIGMKNGRKLVEVELANSQNVTVLKANAEVEEPLTCYAFTGQGSAEVKMGMDLYASSSVAKGLWDRAESHLLQTFGFSILNIINTNPKQLTVHFGGPKGARIR